MGCKQPCPLVAFRAAPPGHGARWQCSDQQMEVASGHRRTQECGLTVLVRPEGCEDLLGEIDPNIDNVPEFPLPMVS
jgi:hypothetical protein